jgi:hypothetical protein
MTDIVDEAEIRAFLDDALRQPTPCVMLVGDFETADRYAAKISQDGVPGRIGPLNNDRWVTFSQAEALANGASGVSLLLSRLPASDTWLYLRRVDAGLTEGHGRQLLDGLCDLIADGRLRCVLVSITAAGYEQLTSSRPRLAGLSTVVEFRTDPPTVSELAYLAVRTGGARDIGWLVMVKTLLREPPVANGSLPGDIRTDAALQLTDHLAMHQLPDGTIGISVSFKPHAFAVGQQTAAFSAAELVARRALGRELAPGEWVEAARGVVYF